MKTIATYSRVSTDDQKVDMQLDGLRKYAEMREVEIYREYVDHASGANESRSALNEMLADARRGKFDVLVVWKIDRLGRSVVHLLSILTELQTLGIAFVSLQEAIDTTTPAGKMVFTFLGAVAEFERGIISERVRAGMAAASKRGKHCGRPKALVDLSLAKKLRAEGKSLRQIATVIGVSHVTLHHLLAAT
jgi:DNA invertase Pin-like site-specific DNA recombinase